MSKREVTIETTVEPINAESESNEFDYESTLVGLEREIKNNVIDLKLRRVLRDYLLPLLREVVSDVTAVDEVFEEIEGELDEVSTRTEELSLLTRTMAASSGIMMVLPVCMELAVSILERKMGDSTLQDQAASVVEALRPYLTAATAVTAEPEAPEPEESSNPDNSQPSPASSAPAADK